MAHPPSTVVLALGLTLSLAVHQDRQSEPPRFKVGVDLVRIDAVVTDRDGRIVTDLTADDFEVRQNGKPQKVTFAQFVPVLGAPERAPGSPPAAIDPAAPAAPAAIAARQTIQRTLVIVVDDLGLSVESLSYTKRALHAFVDRELRPTDLVAIVRSGGSAGLLQSLTTDPRVAHAAIDGLRWNGFSRRGVEAFEHLNTWTTFDGRSGLADPNDFKKLETLRDSMTVWGSLGALNLAILGARELPGRKAVIFASEGFTLQDQEGLDSRVRLAVDRAIDQAARAGVVVYSLDCRGLQTGGLVAADNFKSGGLAPGAMDAAVRAEAATRYEMLRNTQEGMAYLAEQTGGFAVLNTSDLMRGLERISDDVRDYYVIGYVPEEGTFAPKGQKPRYHQIDVRVRRPGVRVKTRKEFLGVADPPETTESLTPAHHLVQAAISPFTAAEIVLRATALPGYAPERGTFVKALLHIDARGLTFVATDDGRKRASADVVGMVFNQDGMEVAHLSTGFSVALTDQAAEDALRDGLAYTLRIPISRPGAYQVRFAIRDRQSGKLGSAGEFVEVPDIAGGAFALSGIVLQNGDTAAANATEEDEHIALSPSQALRIYRPGTELSYAYEIYNAGKEVQAAPSIWRGTQKVLAVPPDTLLAPEDGASRFAARGRLKFGDGLPPGGYLLQIAAATPDTKHKGRLRTAVQRIHFEVR